LLAYVPLEPVCGSPNPGCRVMGQVVHAIFPLEVARTAMLVAISRELIESLGHSEHPQYEVGMNVARDMMEETKTTADCEHVADWMLFKYCVFG
jgi:hypothetical protein